jgi:hypothetical protein
LELRLESTKAAVVNSVAQPTAASSFQPQRRWERDGLVSGVPQSAHTKWWREVLERAGMRQPQREQAMARIQPEADLERRSPS